MQQSMAPARVIFHAGDVVMFRLEGVAPGRSGKAVVRTNLGRAEIRRRELVECNEAECPLSGLDWHDLELEKQTDGAYTLAVPLLDVGIFEAKCCFLPDDGSPVEWPRGDNWRIKVESAASVSANSIYAAFVRQFGAGLAAAASTPQPEAVARLTKENYTVIPPSGTFRDLIRQFDHIFGDLGCRILQLLPVHPAPTQYGRMGLYGSPFAALDYFNVDPALAEFDPKATPLEQFGELVDAVHARDGRIFLDIPVNHTGWAAKLQGEHPEYFVRKPDGTFESPGAWGVVWEDLCKLDYQDPKVSQLMAKVFLFWCRRGVDGFRCDAGYMLPEAAWNYIIAKVREEYPDTIFFLEGLGGPLALQERLLGRSGLNWAYSELFQNYSRDEIGRYQPYIRETSRHHGTLVNFAETHDNLRLAATSPCYARLRFLVAALMAENGSFGFANGAEFLATEKIDVHGNGGLNWGREPNLVSLVRQLNTLLADHPAFQAGSTAELIQTGGGNVLALLRRAVSGERILALFNLDCDREARVEWGRDGFPAGGRDLLGGSEVAFQSGGNTFSAKLAPGEVFCLAFDDYQLPEFTPNREPGRIRRQRADAMARRAAVELAGFAVAGKLVNPGEAMLADPAGFASVVAGVDPAPLTVFHLEFDARRRVMVPPGDLLRVTGAERFRVELREERRTVAADASLRTGMGDETALLVLPKHQGRRPRELELFATLFPAEGGVRHLRGTILQLPSPRAEHTIELASRTSHRRLGELHAFGANEFGGYSFFAAHWGSLYSKYEAILAANVDRGCPVDRRVMFTRCRGWLVVNGYSQPIGESFLAEFNGQPDNRARWRFRIPVGQGCRAELEIDFRLAFDGDAVRLRFRRPAGKKGPGELDDAQSVKIILRPDIEDRINHEVTKAFQGAEKRFPEAVAVHENGFDFTPAERQLRLRLEHGHFHREPEWQYQVELPQECYYGLECKTDLFSPGYFTVTLKGGEESTLSAEVLTTDALHSRSHYRWPEEEHFPEELPVAKVCEPALRRFVVRRDAFSTVIAGYPWFLDWGRDTLIALRGLCAGDFRQESAAIIRQFASFEKMGTIPNVIRGRDESNRDTSDAPLYLILAAREYADRTGDHSILEADCAGRPLRKVLESLVTHIMAGTPNGIVMDPESSLVFSPPHFTWMDTNHPAATPRQGYPIEIQALWFAALEFIGRFLPEFAERAAKVRTSIETLFFQLPNGNCSDCLHAAPGTPAAKAVPDDHIRPNQLFAVTLGAVADRAKARRILAAAEELLVPGGIRSLADRPVAYRLSVERDGRLLNDPVRPYRGTYAGPEDTERKVAYHNGTVWSWPFPAYAEALFRLGGEKARERALAILLSSTEYFEAGIPGQLPEVAHGDAPHGQGGCFAQAWSVSEFYRVYELLTR